MSCKTRNNIFEGILGYSHFFFRHETTGHSYKGQLLEIYVSLYLDR